MRPGTFDWPPQYAGDTADTRVFTIIEGGSPTVITGAVIKMQVRASEADDPILDLSTEDGLSIVITDGANGQFRVGAYLNPPNSGEYLYDLQVTFPDGRVKTYFRGSYVIESQVTR